MSKNTSPRRIKIADYKASKADEGAIILEDDNGREYRIPPRAIWSDELLNRIKNVDAEDPVAQARALLGDEEYDAFHAGGGEAMMVSSIIDEEWGESVPNS